MLICIVQLFVRLLPSSASSTLMALLACNFWVSKMLIWCRNKLREIKLTSKRGLTFSKIFKLSKHKNLGSALLIWRRVNIKMIQKKNLLRKRKALLGGWSLFLRKKTKKIRKKRRIKLDLMAKKRNKMKMMKLRIKNELTTLSMKLVFQLLLRKPHISDGMRRNRHL